MWGLAWHERERRRVLCGSWATPAIEITDRSLTTPLQRGSEHTLVIALGEMLPETPQMHFRSYYASSSITSSSSFPSCLALRVALSQGFAYVP
jgi:hypothetical protein